MIFDMTKRTGGGGPLPLGLVKVNTLIDHKVIVASDITADGAIATYSLNPLLQNAHSETEWYVIIAFVMRTDSQSYGASEFVSSISFIPFNRAYGLNYYNHQGTARSATAYTSNWGLCGCNNTDASGAYIYVSASSSSEITATLYYSKKNPNNKLAAGEYSVNAVMYKYNPTALGGTL